MTINLNNLKKRGGRYAPPYAPAFNRTILELKQKGKGSAVSLYHTKGSDIAPITSKLEEDE